MSPHAKQSLTQRSQSNRFGIRQVLLFVLLVAVSFGQSSPSMAGNGANWIEICGDGGAYFIAVDEDGQKQAPECTRCDFCLTSAADSQDVRPALRSVDMQEILTNISYFVDSSALPDNPEQYWSACRGPPIMSEENNMTPTTSLSFKEPSGSSFSAGKFPCV
ncbi:MAG: hypothetical protein ACTSRN_08965 [Alphaproteobacteria bacterium]